MTVDLYLEFWIGLVKDNSSIKWIDGTSTVSLTWTDTNIIIILSRCCLANFAYTLDTFISKLAACDLAGQCVEYIMLCL